MALTKISRSLLDTGVSDSSDATAITIDSSENVTLAANLEVSGADVTITSNIIHAGDGNTFFGFNDADTFRIVTGGSEALRVNSSQNVGIGTSSPSSALHVTTSTANTNGMVRLQNNMDNNYETLRIESLGDYDAHIGFFADGSSNYYWGAGVDYSDSGKFKISNDNLLATNTRFTITTDGKVFIGTTTEVDSNCTALHTKATASTKWVQAMSGVDRGMVKYTTATSGTVLFDYYVYNGSVVGSISSTGSSTAYNTSSDYRLKENVDYTWDATTRLKQLKPARFNFIADETNTLVDGFLAHEVQDIVPEAITGEKDAVDIEGNPEYQGIDQSKLVPLLVKTIQELEARITTLEG